MSVESCCVKWKRVLIESNAECNSLALWITDHWSEINSLYDSSITEQRTLWLTIIKSVYADSHAVRHVITHTMLKRGPIGLLLLLLLYSWIKSTEVVFAGISVLSLATYSPHQGETLIRMTHHVAITHLNRLFGVLECHALAHVFHALVLMMHEELAVHRTSAMQAVCKLPLTQRARTRANIRPW